MNNQPIEINSNIIVECSQSRSKINKNNYAWENEVGEININVGDSVSVFQSFVNVRGASNETIALIDDTIDNENPTKTPIEIQFYKTSDGLNSLPNPYSYQLLSLGQDEANKNNVNEVFKTNNTSGTSFRLDKMRGMFVEPQCPINNDFTYLSRYVSREEIIRDSLGSIIGTIASGRLGTFSNVALYNRTLLSNLINPIDCSRYTLMELYRSGTYDGTDNKPLVKHRIKTGTHTFNLDDNYYTPQNLADALTESINNSSIDNVIDEFGGTTGFGISSPVFINEKGLYIRRKNHGGTLAHSGTEWQNGYGENTYQPRSVYGFDLCYGTRSGGDPQYAGSGFGGADILNFSAGTGISAGASEYFYKPSPSWDFYGGSGTITYGYNEGTAPITDLREHINYYFFSPKSVMAGEELFNKELEPNANGSVGNTGTLITNYLWNDDNLNLFKNLFDTAYDEGVYDNLKQRDTTNMLNYGNLGGTDYLLNNPIGTSNSGLYQDIKYNHNIHRVVSVAQQNPSGTDLDPQSYFGINNGSVSVNAYYGYNTNQYGYNFKCDNAGLTRYEMEYLEDTSGTNLKVDNFLNRSIGTYGINYQFIDYDSSATDIANGYGFAHKINSDGEDRIAFKVGSSSGGFITQYNLGDEDRFKFKVGWFPSFLDINNRSINYISVDGLGSEDDTQIFTGSSSQQIDTQCFSRDLTNGTISPGTSLTLPRGWSSSNPNVKLGCIPQFDFDNSISRFTISNMYQPQFQANSQTASRDNQLISNGGQPIIIINPIFQQSRNFRIERYENLTPTHNSNANSVPIFFNNSDRNRNKLIQKPIILDSSMGIFISKWSVNNNSETFSNTLWGKMGFLYEDLISTNNRQYRNENYLLGLTPTISNPPTNNVQIDTSFISQFSRNAFNFPTFNNSDCGDVLQREITGSSTQIISTDLPIKNFTPYYIIETDLLNHAGYSEYRQSSNLLPAIDVCALNYNSSDYYYAEPSGLNHQFTKNTRISSIKTNIRRPDGKLATELSGNSSIIYKISKTNLQQPYQEPDYTDILNNYDKSTKRLKAIGGGVKQLNLKDIYPLYINGLLPNFDFEGEEDSAGEDIDELVEEQTINNINVEERQLNQDEEDRQINLDDLRNFGNQVVNDLVADIGGRIQNVLDNLNRDTIDNNVNTRQENANNDIELQEINNDVLDEAVNINNQDIEDNVIPNPLPENIIDLDNTDLEQGQTERLNPFQTLRNIDIGRNLQQRETALENQLSQERLQNRIQNNTINNNVIDNQNILDGIEADNLLEEIQEIELTDLNYVAPEELQQNIQQNQQQRINNPITQAREQALARSNQREQERQEQERQRQERVRQGFNRGRLRRERFTGLGQFIDSGENLNLDMTNERRLRTDIRSRPNNYNIVRDAQYGNRLVAHEFENNRDRVIQYGDDTDTTYLENIPTNQYQYPRETPPSRSEETAP